MATHQHNSIGNIVLIPCMSNLYPKCEKHHTSLGFGISRTRCTLVPLPGLGRQRGILHTATDVLAAKMGLSPIGRGRSAAMSSQSSPLA